MPVPAKSDTSAKERAQTAGAAVPDHQPPLLGVRRSYDQLRQPPHHGAQEDFDQPQLPHHHDARPQSDQLQQPSHHGVRRAHDHHGGQRDSHVSHHHDEHHGGRRDSHASRHQDEHHGGRRDSHASHHHHGERHGVRRDSHASHHSARKVHEQHGGQRESDQLQQPSHHGAPTVPEQHVGPRDSEQLQEPTRQGAQGAPEQQPQLIQHVARRVSYEEQQPSHHGAHRPQRSRSLPTTLGPSARFGVVNDLYARRISVAAFTPSALAAAHRASYAHAAGMEPEHRRPMASAVAAAAMALQTPMARRRLSEQSTLHPLVPLCNFLLFAMCVTVIAVLLFGFLAAYLDGHNVHPVAMCTSHACREYAQRLLDSLNRSVDPCDSFTHFVCDGWRKRHMFGVHEKTFSAATERITRIVHTIDVPISGQNNLQRAAALFRTCNALLKRPKSELAEVKATLREAGVTWPHRPYPADQRDLVRMMLHCDYTLGWSAVFRVDLEQLDNETKAYVLTDSAFNFIVRKHREWGWQQRQLRYFTVLRDAFRNTDEDANLVTFEETLALEGKILEPLLAEVHAKTPLPSAIPAQVVYSAAANLSMGRWTASLEREGVKVQERLNFYTWHLPFFATFVDLWTLHGEQEMYAYVSWCTVQVAALFASADLIENFYGHKQRATIFHGAFCLSRAFIGTGKPLLASYAHEVLPQSTRSHAESLTLTVRAAFLGRLSTWAEYKDSVGVFRLWDSNWMAFNIFEPTPKTKFDVIVGEMGGLFLQNWRNAWLSRTGFRNMDIMVAVSAIENLAFSADIEYRKDFILLPYAFSFPYYDADALRAINYGGFGSKVALAAGERFYSSYLSAGAGGSSLGEFRSCLTNDSFGVDQSNEASLVAEVVSLGVLVDAYRNASDNRRLVLLDRVTDEQLLFIASCYAKCTGSYYPVNDLVCDAALQHVPEFAQAFNCAPDTPMNPHRRCKLF